MDRKIFTILLFLAAIGLCSGSFFEVYMKGSGKEELITLLGSFFSGDEDTEGISLAYSFWESFKPNFIAFLIYFISPVIIILLPAIPAFMFLKGVFIGFSAAMIFETFGIKGLYYVLVTIIPQNIIVIFVFAFLGMISFKYGIQVIGAILAGNTARGRKNKNALQGFARQYIKCYSLGLAAIIISCLIEAFLLQSAL